MQNQALLRQNAIEAAKKADWQCAVAINEEIVQKYPEDLEAMNRLGLAYLKTDQEKKAKLTFKTVLKFDRSNIIANKHLKKIKNKEKSPDVVFSSFNDFIEEPGKSKIVTLHRLASRSQLNDLKVGETCFLHPKSRYISIVNDQNKHIGALPEDISFRLSKLIKTGNQYSCTVYKVADNQCCVLLKETVRSDKNAQLQSFPSKKINTQFNISDDFIMEEDIPVEIIDTENDDDNEGPESGLKIAMEKIDKKEI